MNVKPEKSEYRGREYESVGEKHKKASWVLIYHVIGTQNDSQRDEVGVYCVHFFTRRKWVRK